MFGILVGTGVLAADAAAQPDLAKLAADAPTCDVARKTCLGIALHVPVTEDGPIATSAWIASQLAEANRHFALLDIGFQIVRTGTLPASVARIEDRQERDTLGARLGTGVIDLFLTGQLDDIDTSGAQANGVTWRKGSRKFVIVSTRAWERTLAHELGHVFGLPHSTHAISIMNKTERAEPPHDQRTFHADELTKMTPRIRHLVRAKVFTNLATKRPARVR